LGIPKVVERAKAMGLEGPFPFDLSVSLGSVAVSPINLTEAYTTFANGGEWSKGRLIRSVKDAWGDDIISIETQRTQGMDPETSYIMSTLLKEVVQDGTGWRLKELKRPIGGKTGTTNDEKDAWFVGVTPYLVTTAYVGFDQLTPMGKWETGSRAASPVVRDYLKEILDDYPKEDFEMPAGVIQVRIDAGSGRVASAYSGKSYFLPFKQGTQPTIMQGQRLTREQQDPVESGEDLLKQMF
jgi:penicillin-binding protein 1A